MKKLRGRAKYIGLTMPENLMLEVGRIVDKEDSVYRSRNEFVKIAIREKIVRDTGQLMGKRVVGFTVNPQDIELQKRIIDLQEVIMLMAEIPGVAEVLKKHREKK